MKTGFSSGVFSREYLLLQGSNHPVPDGKISLPEYNRQDFYPGFLIKIYPGVLILY